MFPYIYAERNGFHILDLVKTSGLLEDACSFVYSQAKEKKTILFVGTHYVASHAVRTQAKRSGSPYVDYK